MRLLPGLAGITFVYTNTIGSSVRGEQRYHLPRAGRCVTMASRSVRHSIVNGVTTYAEVRSSVRR